MFLKSRNYIYLTLLVLLFILILRKSQIFSSYSLNNADVDVNFQSINVSLFPHDHINAMRLEQDGDVNMDYWREILFGINHHLVSNDRDSSIKLIKKLFYRYDRNRDKSLDHIEIYQLVSENIEKHIDRAHIAHKEAFRQLKSPHRNVIPWRNFIVKYLVITGHSSAFIEKYLVSENNAMLHKGEAAVVEAMRQSWHHSDRDEDNQLSESEYLSLLHPELDVSAVARMADKVMDHLDLNRDDLLTIAEFAHNEQHHIAINIVTPYPGFVPPPDSDSDISPDNPDSRKQEFTRLIDRDHDGFATRLELMEYLNPHSVANSHKDVEEIIGKIDGNSDRMLTLSELIQNYQKVINSKMVNVAKEFHKHDL